MQAQQLLDYLTEQRQLLEELIAQLDEIQVYFNARYDSFKYQHDTTLDHVTQQIVTRLDTLGPELQEAISERLPLEYERIEERLQKVTEEYLPRRHKAADALMEQAQAELAQLRSLNPQLDQQEEELKSDRARIVKRLSELNDEIRTKSRGLGVIRHLLAINNADRERQRLLGKLEAIDESLYHVRNEWNRQRQETEKRQTDLQERWQLESIAVARLRAEIDQISDPALRDDLALRRAIRHVLDTLKKPVATPDSELEVDLQQMVELNIQTDAYHEGLAAVGGLIGLLRGIDSGMQAISRSVEGLIKEQQMHSAYLAALSFDLSHRTKAFHSLWPSLAKQFADENLIGEHPAKFAASTGPLLENSLSESSIEGMFQDLGASIQAATSAWQ
jgi:hypothetical protein